MAFYYFTSSMNPTAIRICLLFSLLVGMASAQLSSDDFYTTSCPEAVSTIQSAVNTAVSNETRMGAYLLRLHFHDCFVNAWPNDVAHAIRAARSLECECDASVLLDDILETFTGEKIVIPNANSVRGFDVIDTIKSQLESLCPSVVSCADILVVAVRDSVVALSEPNWSQAVPLGRRGLLAGAYKLSISHDHVPVPPSRPNPCTYVPGSGVIGHCTKH